MEIVLGFGFMAFLFIIIGLLLSREKNFPLGPYAMLLFTGFALVVMNLMAGALYTEWNNTLIFNSSVAIPDTLSTLSFWSIWVYILFVVLGLILWLMNWFAKVKG